MIYKLGSTDKRHQATMGGPDEAGDQWLSSAIEQGFNRQSSINKSEQCHRYLRNRPGQFEYADATKNTRCLVETFQRRSNALLKNIAF